MMIGVKHPEKDPREIAGSSSSATSSKSTFAPLKNQHRVNREVQQQSAQHLSKQHLQEQAPTREPDLLAKISEYVLGA